MAGKWLGEGKPLAYHSCETPEFWLFTHQFVRALSPREFTVGCGKRVLRALTQAKRERRGNSEGRGGGGRDVFTRVKCPRSVLKEN